MVEVGAGCFLKKYIMYYIKSAALASPWRECERLQAPLTRQARRWRTRRACRV